MVFEIMDFSQVIFKSSGYGEVFFVVCDDIVWGCCVNCWVEVWVC